MTTFYFFIFGSREQEKKKNAHKNFAPNTIFKIVII